MAFRLVQDSDFDISEFGTDRNVIVYDQWIGFSIYMRPKFTENLVVLAMVYRLVQNILNPYIQKKMLSEFRTKWLAISRTARF